MLLYYVLTCMSMLSAMLRHRYTNGIEEDLGLVRYFGF